MSRFPIGFIYAACALPKDLFLESLGCLGSTHVACVMNSDDPEPRISIPREIEILTANWEEKVEILIAIPPTPLSL